MKNIVIFVLLAILGVVLYKYYTTLNNLDVLKQKLRAEDMVLFKESDEIYSIIGKNDRLTILLNYNTYGLYGISIEDLLFDKSIYFNFLDENDQLTYSYRVGNKYIVSANIYYYSLNNKLVERNEWINGCNTFYELFNDGATKMTVKTDVWE
jgi:hypothetical protein